MKRWIIAATAVVVLGITTAVVVANTGDGCPPLMECFDDEGTLYVRNSRPMDVRLRMVRTGSESAFDVRAGSTEAYTDLACKAVRLIIVDAQTGAEVASADGPICDTRTWTVDAGGGSTMTAGPPGK